MRPTIDFQGPYWINGYRIWLPFIVLAVVFAGMQALSATYRPLEGNWVVDSFEKDNALSHSDRTKHHLRPGGKFSLVWVTDHYAVKDPASLWPVSAWSEIKFEPLQTNQILKVDRYLKHLGRQPLGDCASGKCAMGNLVISSEGHHSAAGIEQTHVVLLVDVSHVRTLKPCDSSEIIDPGVNNGHCLRIEMFCVSTDSTTPTACDGDTHTLTSDYLDTLEPLHFGTSGEPIHGGLGHSHGKI